MKFNRKILFDGLRANFGKLDAEQVSVIAAIVDEFERRKLNDQRYLAYMLATPWGECNWRPVREIGRGKGKKYGVSVNGQIYYGRGLVQLTWHKNYELMGDRLKLPLVTTPDMAMIVPVAVQIMFEGMIWGLFTGKRLGDYFGDTTDDPVNARRIINGKDKAQKFAEWHKLVLAVLKDAVRPDMPAVKPAVMKPQPAHVEFDNPVPPKADLPQLDVVVPAAAEDKMQKGIASLLVAIAAAIGLGLLAVVAFFKEK
jgi:putative chitinase